MDVDKVLEAYARAARREAKQAVSFTPDVEQAIRERLEGRRRNKHRLLAGAAVVCGLAAVFIWQKPLGGLDPAVNPDSRYVAWPEYPLQNGKLSPQADQTLKKLVAAIPALKQASVSMPSETGDEFELAFRIGERVMAEASIHRNTGTLRMFQRLDLQGGDQAVDAKTQWKAAEAFVQALLGNDSERYRVVKTSPVVFQAYVNDLPVLGAQITVSVNMQGEIVGCWNIGESLPETTRFPKPEGAYPPEAVEHAIAAAMKLKYVEHAETTGTIANSSVGKEPLLVYSPSLVPASTVTMDAVTGEVRSSFAADYREPVVLSVRSPASPLVVKSKQEAAAWFEREMGVRVEGTPVYEEERTRGIRREKTYLLGRDHAYQLITDAQTGYVTGAVLDGTSGTGDGAKNDDVARDAQQEAVRFLEQFLEPSVTEVQLVFLRKLHEVPNRIEFGYVRSHDGVPVLRSPSSYITYRVVVDTATGRPVQFYRLEEIEADSGRRLSFPDKAKAIPPEEAARLYVQARPIELAYSLEQGQDDQVRPVLVYTFDTRSAVPVMINALTGETVPIQTTR